MFEEKIRHLRKYTSQLGIPDPEEFMNDFAEPKQIYQKKVRAWVGGRLRSFNLMGVLHCNVYSTGDDPYKGGFRYHPDVTLDRLKVLGLGMTQKTALGDIHFGGAKFGMPIDPRKFSKGDLRVITEEATLEMLCDGILKHDNYVPGPDVNTNAETMFWIYNRAAKLNPLANRANVAAMVTGKPLYCHGCPGREDATSRGLLVLLSEYLEIANRGGSTIAIQGFGNVGMNLAKLINEEFKSFQVNAVSDVSGGIYDKDGLDVKDVLEYYRQRKTFKGYQDDRYELSNPDALLHLPVDFLIPAAMENQITAENVHMVQAKMIIEGGNDAVTPEAQGVLEAIGIPFIPGIAANAGGVTVSYLEWSRNRGQRRHSVNFTEDLRRVHEDLEKIMKSIIRDIHEKHLRENLPLAEAADLLALQRLAQRWQMKHR